ncbi:helix-turn-helix transcriptional regulator [Billgrantia lactosivorans]|uniref:helix-turn-helix transcriptional regulator n=1 Tax=Billgrantia lactosivorans TaxID=2185141 RepID=UPI000DADAF60|nr:AlpA family phage regulatory protein [Halomonas lactosivorans]
MNRLIKRKVVLEKTALSNSSLYRLIASGDFPPPIQLGARSVAWVEFEVEKWIEGKMSLSRSS